MDRFSFIARMPDKPGSMEKAAAIVRKYKGNIERIHYDHRIDPCTVFFEVSCTEKQYVKINEALKAIGYLQTNLAPLSFLKFSVYLPNHAGALFKFLKYTTMAKANIAYIDFGGQHAGSERLTVSLMVEKSSAVEMLLDQLKSHYRIEITEYDTSGRNLDDTVFYIRFAQQLRELIGDAENDFLMHLLSDINRIVQELTILGQNPKQVFSAILEIGKALKQTENTGFYADMQRITLSKGELICLQMPCGGNVYLLISDHEIAMIDTGYGIYHNDLLKLFYNLNIEETKINKIFLTHADADHAGATRYFSGKVHMHPGTRTILQKMNRAYGSRAEGSILEEVYTHLINVFSHFNPALTGEEFSLKPSRKQGAFDIIGEFNVGKIKLKVLNGLGGHVHGQVYFFCEEEGLLFTADSLINFSSLTPEREHYNTLAKFLMTSVNVDSEIAKQERRGLLLIAENINALSKEQGKQCLICGGHGAVSYLEGETLKTYGEVVRLEN